MTDIRVGDYVRATVEGRLERYVDGALIIDTGTENGVPTRVSALGTTVAKIAPPEPEYELGAYYMDADGDVFRCFRDGNRPAWLGFYGDVKPYDHPARPLRIMRPERL